VPVAFGRDMFVLQIFLISSLKERIKNKKTKTFWKNFSPIIIFKKGALSNMSAALKSL
jgi:hypothetical protein